MEVLPLLENFSDGHTPARDDFRDFKNVVFSQDNDVEIRVVDSDSAASRIYYNDGERSGGEPVFHFLGDFGKAVAW